MEARAVEMETKELEGQVFDIQVNLCCPVTQH